MRLPDLTAHWSAPILFRRLVVLRHPGDEVIESIPAADTLGKYDDDPSLLDAHVDLVANGDVGLLHESQGKPDSMAVAPLLYLGQHDSPPQESLVGVAATLLRRTDQF